VARCRHARPATAAQPARNRGDPPRARRLAAAASSRSCDAQDENNLREALKHSAAMLGELRTSLLSPQKYYALYMKTFDELRYLEAFFVEENKRGRSNAELYEIVQHAGNILPRMCVKAAARASVALLARF
jgi:hypothetical protein